MAGFWKKMAAVLMIMLGISVAPIRADAQDTKDCTNTRYLQELIDELDFDELDMSLEENHLPMRCCVHTDRARNGKAPRSLQAPVKYCGAALRLSPVLR